MYKIGSHDSMSYLPPKHWWLYPFRFMAQCQSKTIEEQYEKYNARLFDIRLSFTRKGKVEFRHGAMAFKGDVEKTFEYLNSKGDVEVRIFLEEGHNDFNNFQEEQFVKYCPGMVERYPNIKFFCGVRKRDWKKLYDFGYDGPSYADEYASWNDPVTGSGFLLDDLYPKSFAKKYNHQNRLKGTDKEYLMLDFIEIE